jgi:alginate O-acetyltransferase complex protein AlgI
MSLSTFFRDYVYIPLGGNRQRQLFNLFVVWFLTGLWHGADWNHVLWGLYYLVFLILEKYFLGKLLDKIPAILRHLYTIIAVTFGWTLFYFDDLGSSVSYIKACLFMNGVTDYLSGSVFISRLFLIAVLILACTTLPKRIAARLTPKAGALVPLFNTLVIAGSYILIVAQNYNPFLYYKF